MLYQAFHLTPHLPPTPTPPPAKKPEMLLKSSTIRRPPPPKNALAISLLLSHISARPSSLTTPSAQREFLTDLTSKYNLPYHSSTYGNTFHDARSLRSALIAMMRQQGVNLTPGKKAIDEFFERGREVLRPEYVEAVEKAAEEEMAKMDENGVESEDGDEDEGEGMDEEEERLLREILEDEHSSDEEYEPDGDKKKRGRTKPRPLRTGMRSLSLSTSAEEPEGVDDEFMPDDPRAKIQSKPRSQRVDKSHRPDINGRTLTEKTAAKSNKRSISSDNYDQQLETAESGLRKRKLSYFRLEHDSGHEGDDERAASMSHAWEKPKRRRQHHARSPLPIPQDSEPDDVACAVEASNQLMSGEDEQLLARPHITGVAMSSSPFAEEVQIRTQQLNEKINLTVLTFFALIDLDPSKSADIVLQPTLGLESLYIQSFGWEDCTAIASHLKSQHGLPAGDFLRSLIAAFLTVSILNEATVPWASMLSLLPKDTPFQKYAAPFLAKSVNTRVLLIKEAAAAQLRDDEFLETELRPRARALAADLRLVLRDHLDLLSDGAEKWHETIMQGLQEACEAAMELRGWLDVLGGRVDWLWHSYGEKRQGDCDGLDHKVAFTVFPGIVCTYEGGEMSLPAIVVASY